MFCIVAALAVMPVSPANAASYYCTCKCNNGSTVGKTVTAADDEGAKKKCETFGKKKCSPNGGLKKGSCTVTKTSTHEAGDDGELINL
jgi:hypothetical protein